MSDNSATIAAQGIKIEVIGESTQKQFLLELADLMDKYKASLYPWNDSGSLGITVLSETFGMDLDGEVTTSDDIRQKAEEL
jgi:hypothetical protein